MKESETISRRTKAKLTLIGNEGFCIETGTAVIYVDAFYRGIPGVASFPSKSSLEIPRADLILITHSHWDHFSTDEVAAAAAATKARVAGPRPVFQRLKGRMDSKLLFEMEPEKFASAVEKEFPFAKITAFRTHHGGNHNSYWVQSDGFAFFHDGDNEDTRPLPVALLKKMDALLIGPWQGSGWVEFIELVSPKKYFLMHLSEEELAQHEQGRFLPDICDRVPEGLVVLHPGQSFIFS